MTLEERTQLIADIAAAMNNHSNCLSSDEQQWVRLAITKQEQSIKLRHERKHLEQMQRDGKLLYMLKYSYWLLRFGYRNNPYEVKARQAELVTILEK